MERAAGAIGPGRVVLIIHPRRLYHHQGCLSRSAMPFLRCLESRPDSSDPRGARDLLSSGQGLSRGERRVERVSGFAHSHPLSVWVGKKGSGGSGLSRPPTLASWERVRIQPSNALTCSSSPTVSHFLWAGVALCMWGRGKIASGSLGLFRTSLCS